MLADVEPDLRLIIKKLREGDVERAKDSTVELIESAFRMSGPMYREDGDARPERRSQLSLCNRAARLRTLTKDLRDVSFTMRRGTQADALEMAERALVVFLRAN